jgi:hypothetical protein
MHKPSPVITRTSKGEGVVNVIPAVCVPRDFRRLACLIPLNINNQLI